jgi:hypothetical protein
MLSAVCSSHGPLLQLARVARAGTRNSIASSRRTRTHWPRGDFQAFSAAKASIANILAGDNAGQVVQADHRDWYASD